jgi:hypothetical protein
MSALKNTEDNGKATYAIKAANPSVSGYLFSII